MQDDTSQLSAALERADAAFRAKIDELSFVSRVAEAISRHTSTRELSEELVEVIAETTLSKHAALYRRSLDTRYDLEAASKVFGETDFPASFDLSVLPARFKDHSQPIVIEDIDQESLEGRMALPPRGSGPGSSSRWLPVTPARPS